MAYDWATVDSLCGKVVHNIILNHAPDNTPGETLKQWAKDDKNLWKQRAACVAYIKIAKHGKHTEDIVAIVNDVIKNQERFAQLGAGWVLRELWLAEPQLVVDFITDRYHLFTREGLRYAIEKMDAPLQKTLLKYDPSSGQKIIVKGNSRTPIVADTEDEEYAPSTKNAKKMIILEEVVVPKVAKKRGATQTKLETKPKAKKAKLL